jgi:hypothetical protein
LIDAAPPIFADVLASMASDNQKNVEGPLNFG